VSVVRELSVTVDKVFCAVWGNGPRSANVLIFCYPFKAGSALLKEELFRYGKVDDIRSRAWTRLGNVMMVPGSSI